MSTKAGPFLITPHRIIHRDEIAEVSMPHTEAHNPNRAYLSIRTHDGTKSTVRFKDAVERDREWDRIGDFLHYGNRSLAVYGESDCRCGLSHHDHDEKQELEED